MRMLSAGVGSENLNGLFNDICSIARIEVDGKLPCRQTCNNIRMEAGVHGQLEATCVLRSIEDGRAALHSDEAGKYGKNRLAITVSSETAKYSQEFQETLIGIADMSGGTAQHSVTAIMKRFDRLAYLYNRVEESKGGTFTPLTASDLLKKMGGGGTDSCATAEKAHADTCWAIVNRVLPPEASSAEQVALHTTLVHVRCWLHKVCCCLYVYPVFPTDWACVQILNLAKSLFKALAVGSKATMDAMEQARQLGPVEDDSLSDLLTVGRSGAVTGMTAVHTLCKLLDPKSKQDQIRLNRPSCSTQPAALTRAVVIKGSSVHTFVSGSHSSAVARK
eukprot:COSAG01_NODE_70_length_28755_cov_34.709067_5_plen_334_part_00